MLLQQSLYMPEINNVAELIHEISKHCRNFVGTYNLVLEHAVQKCSHCVSETFVILTTFFGLNHFVHVMGAEYLHVQLRHPDLLDNAGSDV